MGSFFVKLFEIAREEWRFCIFTVDAGTANRRAIRVFVEEAAAYPKLLTCGCGFSSVKKQEDFFS